MPITIFGDSHIEIVIKSELLDYSNRLDVVIKITTIFREIFFYHINDDTGLLF